MERRYVDSISALTNALIECWKFLWHLGTPISSALITNARMASTLTPN
eukprot:CAMPEP_0172844872 /NCGR_PEP_ID=MMETSP1075-20121228/32539_1 /TAXON_ID=2916 /ORGANISM="Ceratium fusus, Strain PA161109" /LENGTH=47 /DNA_ID= /DNA_START= /DNA_END= /DNA_ORIENTATION=